MSWILEVIVQQRGTKQETSEYARFDTREQAESTMRALEADVKAAGPDDFVSFDSQRRRASFLKQDFRRVRMSEERGSSGGGVVA